MTTELAKNFGARHLDPAGLRFFTNPNGVICLEHGDMVYWKISARRALPHQDRDDYIFLYNYNDTEIGAIRCLADLPAADRAVVEALLDRRYFTREIRAVHSLTERFDVLIFKVRTDRKDEVEFTVIRPKDNIHRLRSGGFVILDADHNLYLVPTRGTLAFRDLIRIERYL
ncbi:MAG: DUF1854 domain-containing protein [Planctomycetota bacterium]